ncbi:MAG: AraC family transcriptional regulator [Bacteroidales bacterium]|nr:AraC family transcriptional regulator [Bacteroidales bacterium]
MKIFIKNMVSANCKIIVKSEVEKLGWHSLHINLGEIEITENLSPEEQNQLNNNLKKSGLEILTDKQSILIERIKTIIIERVHFSEDQIKVNFSTYLSEKLDYDYTYLANLFSEIQNINIEQFYLSHKIERAKELIIYDELNITEIADKLHYSSVGHFSNQFKKMTGLTPTHYKHLKFKKRKPLVSRQRSYDG